MIASLLGTSGASFVRARSRVVAVLLCVALGAGTSTAAPPDDDRARQARAVAIFERGEAQFVDGRYDAAATLFQEAWETFPDPAYLLNIGLAFEKAGRWRLAALWYDRFLERHPNAPQVSEARRRRDAAKKSREAARAIVMVASTPSGALAEDVSGKGAEAGAASEAGATCVTPCRLAVDPGPVAIAVTLGDLRAERARSLAPGERWDLDLTLDPSRGTRGAPDEPDRTPSWVAFGVGGAALVVGVVFAALAKGSYDDARALTRSPLGDADFARFESERRDVKTQSLVADLGFLGALTGATVGAILWFDADPAEPSPSEKPAARASTALTPRPAWR